MAGWKIYSTENNSNTKEPIEQNSQSSNELQNSNDVKALEEDIKSTDLDAELNTSELEAGITELQ